jgi:hypothetical protein
VEKKIKLLRLLFAALAGLLLGCFCLPLAAQTLVPRDAMAIGILQQMNQATGWLPGAVPTDAVATGTVNRAVAGDTATVTYKVRQSGGMRVEVQDSATLTTTIVSNGQGAVVRSDGTVNPLSAEETLSLWAEALPFFSPEMQAAANPAFSAKFLGTDAVNGKSCQKVQVTAPLDPNDPRARVLSAVANVVLWIDSASGVLTQVQYTRIASDNPTATRTVIRQFSNYQQVGNLLVPFTQQEYTGGQLLSTLQLQAVNFNTGLTDADFALPQVGQ